MWDSCLSHGGTNRSGFAAGSKTSEMFVLRDKRSNLPRSRNSTGVSAKPTTLRLGVGHGPLGLVARPRFGSIRAGVS